MLTSLAGDIKIADTEELTKHNIRVKVWNYLEESKLARFPTPVHNRIPNFEGAANCGHRVADLRLFASSNTIKVNPDKPQEEVRFLTLKCSKKLLVPSPRLKSGLFNLLENEGSDNTGVLRKKSMSEGVKFLSKPIGLENKIKVDLIVVGSTAVSLTGRRLGKGEGYADLEYAMMKTMGAVDDSVSIVTTVHDCQVFDDLPSRLFRDYDMPVDVIVTPTQVIDVTQKLSRPKGLYWQLLSLDKFLQIPVLRTLYEIEKSNGVDVTLLNGDVPPDHQQEDNVEGRRGGGRGRGFQQWNGEGEAQRGFGRGRRRAGRQGRSWGRGWRKEGGRGETIQKAGEQSDLQDDDALNIQVTINVNKQNKIVRRNVEATNQPDRVGSALDSEGESAARPARKAQNVRKVPTFSVFVGGIPRNCRPRDLQAELPNHGVPPAYITWKGAKGFAFLNFHEDISESSRIVESLQGMKVHDTELKVSLANNQRDEQSNNSRLSDTVSSKTEERRAEIQTTDAANNTSKVAAKNESGDVKTLEREASENIGAS